MKYPYKQAKTKGRRIDEHRLKVEKLIGRKLGRFEFVHHVDEDKRNNEIENLEIVTPVIHAIRHNQWKHPKTWKCEVCGEDFTPPPTKRGGKKRTCSKACRYILASRTLRNSGGPRSLYRTEAYPSEIAKRKP
jgi:hypothetical protein